MSDIKVPEGYKQTEIGVIPEDWDLLSVREICDLLTGFPFPSSKYQDSGIRLLRGSNVKRGNTDWDENITRFWSESTSGIEQYLLQKDDVVISMDGSLVGRSFAQLSDSDLPSLLLQRVARLRARVVSQNYLKEWICSPIFSDYCDSVKTVTAIPHISPADILNFRLLIPKNKKEQTAIATALSDVDNLIGSLEKLIAKKEAIKTGTMQQLLTGKTRLPEFATRDDGSPKGFKQTELGWIPEDWEVVRIIDNHIIATGNTPPTNDQRNYKGKFLFVSPADLGANKLIHNTQKKLSSKGFKLARKFPKGSTLFTCIGSTIGKTGLATCELTSNQQINAVFPNEIDDFEFTYYALTHHSKRIKNKASEQAVPLINKTEFGQFEYMQPNELKEQNAIASILSDMDAEIQSLQGRLEKTKDIKQGMMQQLLTGKVRLAH